LVAVLKGHGFSRAEDGADWSAALAAEGMQVIWRKFSSGAKARPSCGLLGTTEVVPFQAVRFDRSIGARHSNKKQGLAYAATPVGD
jgi:hypothetical protein